MAKEMRRFLLAATLALAVLLGCQQKSGLAASDSNYDLEYLTTHGYALGVASNFNIFATDQYSQASDLGNARVAAGNFKVNGWQKKLGWTSPKAGVDSHMLVVGKSNADSNTNSTVMDTDQTEGVFAADDAATAGLVNRKQQKVTVDPIAKVNDFTANGLDSFAKATDQVQTVSAFYNSESRLTKAFSAKFLNDTTLTSDQMEQIQKGQMVTIDDENGVRKFLVVNVPATSLKDLETDDGRLAINIKYVTKTTQEPIVILNFPNLGGEMHLNGGAADLNVSYGTADNQTKISDKQHLLLNLSQLSVLELNNVFIGTILAPNATVQIDSLNSVMTAVIAKNVSVNNAVSTQGPDGVFNPPDFADPDNSGTGGDQPDQSVSATAKHLFADEQDTTSTAFDTPAQIPNLFTYNDQAEYDLRWEGYEGSRLYRSDDDGVTWKMVGDAPDAGGNGHYDSVTDRLDMPGHQLALTASADSDSATLTAADHRTVSFALAKSNPENSKDAPEWSSSIQLNLAPFKLTVPETIAFDSGRVKNGQVTPTTVPRVKLTNLLGAGFDLTLGVDATSATTDPTSAANNVFLGANQFTYDKQDLTNPSRVLEMTAEQQVGTDPLANNASTTYDLTRFNLMVPAQLMLTAAKVGLTWHLNWLPDS